MSNNQETPNFEANESPEAQERIELRRINDEIINLSKELGFSSGKMPLGPILGTIQDSPDEGWAEFDSWCTFHDKRLGELEKEVGVNERTINQRIGMAILALMPFFDTNYDEYGSQLELLLQYIDGLPSSKKTRDFAIADDVCARIINLRLPESQQKIALDKWPKS
jgi:hypothetical protein